MREEGASCNVNLVGGESWEARLRKWPTLDLRIPDPKGAKVHAIVPSADSVSRLLISVLRNRRVFAFTRRDDP
jgi:hypothetical protein